MNGLTSSELDFSCLVLDIHCLLTGLLAWMALNAGPSWAEPAKPHAAEPLPSWHDGEAKPPVVKKID